MDLFELGIIGLVIGLIIIIIVGTGVAVLSDNNKYTSALKYCGDETILTYQYESFYCDGVELTCNDTNCFPVNMPSNMKRICSPYYNVALKMMVENCHYEKGE